MEHPRNILAKACDILFKTTSVIKWEEEVSGPEHARVFNYVVKINDKEYGRGKATSIQKAKNQAAVEAVIKIREEHPDKKF